MPDIACPVCHSLNASTRTFCWKCAADLHAPAPDPTVVVPPPPVQVPIRPILIGGGVALAAIALIAILVVALGGTPAASISPSGLPTTAPASLGASESGAGASGGTATDAPTLAPATAAAPTPPGATKAPATPKPTPVPKPTIVAFVGPATVNCADPSYTGFITLQWAIDNADSATLSIDSPGVYQSYPGTRGNDQVPFSCGEGQHTYTLTTVGGTGPAATKTLTIVEDSGV